MKAKSLAKGMEKIRIHESVYGKLTPAYRRRLISIVEGTPEDWRCDLTLLALKAFPSSPLQRLLQSLRKDEQK